MSLHKDEAVVLRRLDYSETSQVLAFFTRSNGQIRLIAKGIKRGTKKAFAVGIDLLEAGTVVFARAEGRGGLGTLTEWQQGETFLGLRLDVRCLYAGQYAAEVTAALTEEGDPHPELYDALIDLLRSLAAGGDPVAQAARFQMQLLTSIGLVPILDVCAACHQAQRDGDLEWFSAGQGGMICRDCEPSVVEKRRVAPGIASALLRGELPASLAADAFEILNYGISYAMGRPSRLAPYVAGERG